MPRSLVHNGRRSTHAAICQRDLPRSAKGSASTVERLAPGAPGAALDRGSSGRDNVVRLESPLRRTGLDIQELRRSVKGQVLSDESVLAAVSSDFGRMIVKTPWAILRPAVPEDIVAALAFARRHGIPVSTRAQA